MTDHEATSGAGQSGPRPHPTVRDAGRIARKVVVRGLVQGVFFRDSARREAERLGVTGSIRNEYDGSVVVHAEGTAQAVEVFIDWLRRGPSRAHVDGIEITAEGVRGTTGFHITA